MKGFRNSFSTKFGEHLILYFDFIRFRYRYLKLFFFLIKFIYIVNIYASQYSNLKRRIALDHDIFFKLGNEQANTAQNNCYG